MTAIGTDSTININDVGEYEERNRLVLKCADDLESDILDLEFGHQTLVTLQEAVNTKIHSISRLDGAGVTNIDLDLDSLSNDISKMEYYLMYKLSQIRLFIECTDAKLKAMQSGAGAEYLLNFDTYVQHLLGTEFKSDFDKYISGLTKYGAFWMLDAFVNELGHPIAGFILSHVTDSKYDNGDFCVGDIIGKAVGADSSLLFQSFGMGFVVGGYVFIKDILTDEGDLTRRDTFRASLNAGKHVVEYVTWTYIAGAIGGPTGVAVACGTVVVIDKILTPGIERLLSEDTIYSFSRGNVTYDIPRNGQGKLTYDVILERVFGSEMEATTNERRTEDHFRNWRSMINEKELSGYSRNAQDKMDDYIYRLNHVNDPLEVDDILCDFYVDVQNDLEFASLYGRIKLQSGDPNFIEGYCDFIEIGDEEDIIAQGDSYSNQDNNDWSGGGHRF